jgi:hypothetical protein
MSRNKLDEAIADMRAKSVDDEVVRAAAKRVFRKVFDSAFVPERVERIRGCADFQSLIPAYLSDSLTPARLSLFEDHTLHCVDCRRALHDRREADPNANLPVSRDISRPRKTTSFLPWAVAACLAAGLAIGVTGALKGLLPGQHAVRATIMSVEGTLYRVSDFGSSMVAAGTVITSADELRTAKGSRAILRLINGSRIEMDERSDISLTRGWSGSGVNLERGHVIVQTPDNGQRSFLVRAGDVVVPVKNAVFSVNRGTKGTRIAIARGSAQVDQSQETVQLHAGQQFATDYRLRLVPIATEFAWSQNADYYLGLLSELTNLQKQLQAIPAPGVRYESTLAPYLPSNTVLYAAIPNLGGTVAEAKRIFDERLAESDVLRQWWQQQPASRDNHLDQALTQISSVSQYLGDEIVFAVPANGEHQFGQPIFLAQMRQNGLREYLQQSAFTSAGIQIVSDSATSAQNPARSLFVCLDHGFAVASPDLQELRSVEETIANPAAGGFTQAPFFNRITRSYTNGAGYIFAADMEQIVQKSVDNPRQVPSGFNNAQYLVLERREIGGKSETRAALSFAGSRQGLASWLGAPGPMGSLDFVSPDAIFAAAVVMKNPRTVVNELISSISQSDPAAAQKLNDVQNQLGVNLADDIAAPFGGDATIAIDGPLLPVPAWKLAVEVYDPARLQQTVATLVDHYNQRATQNAGKLSTGSEQVNSRTFYWLRNDKVPNATAYYTFVDGYLLAGPSKGDLLQAIQNRQTGYTLVNSSRFQSQLPADGYTNFSAIIYHNVGSSLGPIASQLKRATPLTSTQQQSLNALLANTDPALICVYGESDRIAAATTASFLGFNLGTLMGVAQGRPGIPLIASSAENAMAAAAGRAQQQTRN